MDNQDNFSRRNAIKLGLGTAAATMVSGSVSAAKPADQKSMFTVPQVFIPITDQKEQFPVRRIYCIGRNYAAHAIEMGSDPTREPPFFFQKPTDAIQYVAPNTVADHPYPTLTKIITMKLN